MRKKFFYFFCGLSILVLLVIIITKNVPQLLEVTTFKKAYNMVLVNEDESLEIPLFISNTNSYFTEKANIESIIISNNDETLKFNLESINENKEKILLKDKWFFKYVYKLKPIIDKTVDITLEMKNAKLEISFKRGTNSSIAIGSLCIYSFNNTSENLSIIKLKGLVNDFDGNKLVGVLMGLKNNTKEDLIIKNIYPLDININASYAEIIELNDFNQKENISYILGYNYKLYENIENDNLEISLSDEIKLFIPIKYKDRITVNKVGFLIEYVMNNELHYYIIDDFLFFDSNDYLISDIRGLVFYTYEYN